MISLLLVDTESYLPRLAHVAVSDGVSLPCLMGQHVCYRCLRPPMRASGYDENGKPVLDDPDRVVSLADSHL